MHIAATFVNEQNHFDRRDVCETLQSENDKEYMEILTLNADDANLKLVRQESWRGLCSLSLL
jgi:UTP-glucose-1-phosphate uridylyltransferase